MADQADVDGELGSERSCFCYTPIAAEVPCFNWDVLGAEVFGEFVP